jgi:putative flippase GtrA
MRDEATVDIRPANAPEPAANMPAPVARAPEPVATLAGPVAKVPEAVARVPGPLEIGPHMRLLHGMRRPANWLQLVRFGLVGGVGFVVNLAVYTLCVHTLGIDYHLAAVAAWMVAVINNFVLNRHWTFDARAGRARFQAIRFLAVSLVALVFSLLLLTILVEVAGLPKLPAQALAVAGSMPLNFLGNKLWSFRTRA